MIKFGWLVFIVNWFVLVVSIVVWPWSYSIGLIIFLGINWFSLQRAYRIRAKQ
jgi:hypothetical protein